MLDKSFVIDIPIILHDEIAENFIKSHCSQVKQDDLGILNQLFKDYFNDGDYEIKFSELIPYLKKILDNVRYFENDESDFNLNDLVLEDSGVNYNDFKNEDDFNCKAQEYLDHWFDTHSAQPILESGWYSTFLEQLDLKGIEDECSGS
jgi:hypothetical protein